MELQHQLLVPSQLLQQHLHLVRLKAATETAEYPLTLLFNRAISFHRDLEDTSMIEHKLNTDDSICSFKQSSEKPGSTTWHVQLTPC